MSFPLHASVSNNVPSQLMEKGEHQSPETTTLGLYGELLSGNLGDHFIERAMEQTLKNGLVAITAPAWVPLMALGSGCSAKWVDIDDDGDGLSVGRGDCNDNPDAGGAAIYPGATEDWYDGVDQNCDGANDYDQDGDGFTSSDYTDEGDATDCNDLDASINPNANDDECDGLDNDCDGIADDGSTFTASYYDADLDGYGDPNTADLSCSTIPSGYVANAGDCNDADAAINASAEEICNEIDDDCDGATDEDLEITVSYADADSDGFGDPNTADLSCDGTIPSGYVLDNTDCDDGNVSRNPDVAEICDAANTDEDCDGLINDDDPNVGNQSRWYADTDSDGYGDFASSDAACAMPTGYVADASDCDDGSALIFPGAVEFCNSVDDDCNSVIDNDSVDSIPFNRDADGDGYGDPTLSDLFCDGAEPSGYVNNTTDCDDTVATVSPAGTEICDDVNADEDCDGVSDNDDSSSTGLTNYYADVDTDGYGAGSVTGFCDPVSGFTTTNTDCDDTSAAINPSASEVCDSSNADEDCDGVANDDDPSVTGTTPWYQDSDRDAWGSQSISLDSCAQPSGYVSDNHDCADTVTTINPGATEICDGIDNNCNSATDDADTSIDTSTQLLWYADADSDSYGDPSSATLACTEPANYVSDSSDCDDADDTTNPAAIDDCLDSDDSNCDGAEIPCEGSLMPDASGTASAAYRGGYAGDYVGYALANLGSNQLAIAAKYYDDGGLDVGGVYVIDSNQTGEIALGSGSASERLYYGIDNYDYAGSSVAAGDVSGDATSDLIVTAVGVDDAATSAGAAYYVPGPFTTDASSLSTASSATILGVAASDNFGYSAAVGDTDADGLAEVAIGAIGWDLSSASRGQGAIYVFSGASFPSGTVSASTYTSRLTGVTASDGSGNALAFCDINGDGQDDLLIGSSNAGSSDAGSITLAYSPLVTGSVSLSTSGGFTGANNFDNVGSSLACAGNSSGSGYNDIIIGAPGVDNGSLSNSGAAYLVPGSPAEYLSSTTLSSGYAMFLGNGDSWATGTSVSGAGDVNGDGFDDFLIGSTGANSSKGLAYLIYGGSFSSSTSSTTELEYGTFHGEAIGDTAGSSVSGLGDVDSDTYFDFAIGASLNDEGGASAGSISVFLGNSY